MSAQIPSGATDRLWRDLPRDQTREDFYRSFPRGARRDIYTKLQHYYHNGRKGGTSLFAQILANYEIPHTQLLLMLRCNPIGRDIQPLLWSRIKLSIDSVLLDNFHESGEDEGVDENKNNDVGVPEESPREGQRVEQNGPLKSLSSFLDCVDARKQSGNWNPEWIRQIHVKDCDEYTASIAANRSLMVNIDHLRFRIEHLVGIVAELKLLEYFTWDSKLPFSTTLLNILANNTPQLIQSQFRLSGQSRHQEHINNNILFGPIPGYDIESLPSSQRSKLAGDQNIIMTEADPESVCQLSIIIGKYFDNVGNLTIEGIRGYGRLIENLASELPSRQLQPSSGLNHDELRTSRNLSIRKLKLIRLGTAADCIVPVLDPAILTDLSIEYCVDLEYILKPLVREAIHLGALKVLLAPADEFPASEIALQKQDQMFLYDFLRSNTSRLKYLDISGPFTTCEPRLSADFSTRGAAHYIGQGDYLFTAIQAHLISLEYLSVIDNFDSEWIQFTDQDLREIGICAPNLVELRIRATLPNEDDGEYSGLLTNLSKQLVYFRQLRALALFRNLGERRGPKYDATDCPRFASAKQTWQTALCHALKARSQGVPLRLLGYEGGGDVDERTWEIFWHLDGSTESVGQSSARELFRYRPSTGEQWRFHDRMDGWVRKMGLPQRGVTCGNSASHSAAKRARLRHLGAAARGYPSAATRRRDGHTTSMD
ncbi:MAG: hypothetical protein M1827_004709 [Pycnora praestabilis]|nr:MAG: hypothetical protein M1827_004709 [Pycnora praestabilis]